MDGVLNMDGMLNMQAESSLPWFMGCKQAESLSQCFDCAKAELRN